MNVFGRVDCDSSTCTLAGFAAEPLDADTDKLSRPINARASVDARRRHALVQVHLAKLAYSSTNINEINFQNDSQLHRAKA